MSKQLEQTTETTTLQSQATTRYKTGIFRWVLYNIFGLAFAASWAAYLMVHNNALFNETFLQYAIIAFIIVNTMFLLAQSFLKDGSNCLEPILLAIACGASFFGCNKYFDPFKDYSTATNTGVMIVGSVIMALLCYIMFTNLGLDREIHAKNSSNVTPSAAFVCLILNGAAFGFCGLGITYGVEGILTADVAIPLTIIGLLTTFNFVLANVAQPCHTINDSVKDVKQG